MLPGDSLSTVADVAPFSRGNIERTSKLTDYELGGVDLQNPTQGLSGYLWKCWADNGRVLIQREGADTVVLFTPGPINELAFAFDRSMLPVVAYMPPGQTTYLRWYDSQAAVYTTTTFGGIRCPRLTMDDKREGQSTSSDVIFAYITDAGELAYRQQRDRYEIQRVLKSDIDPEITLRNIGMTTNWRLKFDLV